MELYRLEDFVECEGNRDAVAMLRSISDAVLSGGATEGLSPCFLHGNFGLGKTHLLRSIVTEMNRSEILAEYISGDDLIDQLKNGLWSESSRFRRCLCVDCLHLAGVDEDSEIHRRLERLFDDVQRRDGFLICSHYASYESHYTFGEPLRARFREGVSVELRPVSQEALKEVIDRNLRRLDDEKLRGTVHPSAIEWLVSLGEMTPRRAIGAAIRLSTTAQLTSSDVDQARAEVLLADLVPSPAQRRMGTVDFSKCGKG